MRAILLFLLLIFFSWVASLNALAGSIYPYETITRTSSYTIPANVIARVDAIADGGTVTLNGGTVLDTTNERVNVAVEINSTGTPQYDVPAGYTFTGHVCNFSGSAGVIRFNRSASSAAISVASGGCTPQNFNIGSGGYIRTSATVDLSVTGVETKNVPGARYASFNAMPGDVINGTGTWRAVITLYR